MAKVTIPAQTTIICDCCKKNISSANYKHQSHLTLVRAAMDFQGQPVADATIRLDLCDSCSNGLASAINKAVVQIQGDEHAYHSRT